MTDSALPAPLVPAEVDLRDFPRMPFEIARLRRSKAWLIAKKNPELGFYMVNLWMASWHDMPAGSLEDDDEVLCDLAMCNAARWPKLREQVMRNWVKCDDGRLYHPTVAQMVVMAWESKQAQRQRTAAATAAKKEKAAAKKAPSDPRDEPPGGSDGQRHEQRDDDRNDERHDDRDGIATFTKRREEKGEGIDKTPQPPTGGKRRESKATGLKAWLEATKGRGEKPIPDDDPVFAYAARVGIPREFLALAWRVFRHRYLEQRPGKRYTDWRLVFRNAVEGNWLKVWFLDPASQQYGLTTVGLQAQRAHGDEGRSAA